MTIVIDVLAVIGALAILGCLVAICAAVAAMTPAKAKRKRTRR